MDTFFQDLRYGLRALRNGPGFAATAILILTVAIGASTTMFSAFDALVLHPLPYRDPEQLVSITESFKKFDITGMQLAAVELDDVPCDDALLLLPGRHPPRRLHPHWKWSSRGRFGPPGFGEHVSHAGCEAHPR